MACNKFNDLCVRFSIRTPADLRKAINIARENVEDGTIIEILEETQFGQSTFSDVAAGAAWDDVFGYRFRCSQCHESFHLHAETYHGSGGYWEPNNRHSVREQI